MAYGKRNRTTRRTLVVSATLIFTLTGIWTGCGSSECERDSDCEEGLVCASSAGVLFADHICIPEDSIAQPDMTTDATLGDVDSGSPISPLDMGQPSDMKGEMSPTEDATSVSDLPPDSCDGVDCGPDGSCVLAEGAATCMCNDDAANVDGRCFASCPEHPDCRYWELDGDLWTAYRVDGVPNDVAAAFDIEGTESAFLISDTELYAFDIASRELTLVGSNQPVVGTLNFDEILTAISIPASHLGHPAGRDAFQVHGLVGATPYFANGGHNNGAFLVEIERSFELQELAAADMIAQWLDIENVHGWAPMVNVCSQARRPVSMMVTQNRVYYGESSGGVCSGVHASDPIDASPMFGLPTAPEVPKIRAAFFNRQKLSVFTIP